MYKVKLDPTQEVDFTVLTKRLHKSEKRKIDLLSEEALTKLHQAKVLSVLEIAEYKRKILSQNRHLDWRNTFYLSKTDAQMHQLAKFYDKGIISTEGYKVIKINLAPAIIDIIALMSNTRDYFKSDLALLQNPLSKLLTGSVEDDVELHDIIYSLTDLENVLLNNYIDKALSRDTRKVVIEPLFGTKTIYSSLTSLECLVLPLALSLNMLSYAIVGTLFNHFRRGDKRFICVDNYSIYYHVRNDMVERFKSGEFYIDNVKLDITFETIESKVKEIFV